MSGKVQVKSTNKGYVTSKGYVWARGRSDDGQVGQVGVKFQKYSELDFGR